MAEVRIEGLDGVLDAMAKLATKAQKKAINHALRAGAKPILNHARRLAAQFDDPATSEKVFMEVAVRQRNKEARKQGYDAGVGVGVLNASKGKDFHYSWFLEEGTSHMPAQPFMRPAMNAQADTAMNAIVSDLQTAIFKE